MITGLTENPGIYVAPQVPPLELQGVLDSLITLGDACVAARAAAEQATVTKDAGREELTDAMKANLRYAEDTVDYDDAQLTLLGWAGLAAPTPLQPPGQVRNLEMPRQGADWIFLDWKKPAEGGPVASYKIERRERPTGDWVLTSLALDSETTLVTGNTSGAGFESESIDQSEENRRSAYEESLRLDAYVEALTDKPEMAKSVGMYIATSSTFAQKPEFMELADAAKAALVELSNVGEAKCNVSTWMELLRDSLDSRCQSLGILD
jgi:hypothetical protein